MRVEDRGWYRIGKRFALGGQEKDVMKEKWRTEGENPSRTFIIFVWTIDNNGRLLTINPSKWTVGFAPSFIFPLFSPFTSFLSCFFSLLVHFFTSSLIRLNENKSISKEIRKGPTKSKLFTCPYFIYLYLQITLQWFLKRRFLKIWYYRHLKIVITVTNNYELHKGIISYT